ncbi:glutamate racemase [Granulicella arctica]|uniref:Glutamate racemase n=1 Tax=Granulicella arctica TaxID=940613 RepID=A0A7Y9PJN4_9BACT|nr:aspartate/glutamate racemase family protein [Granulicella arctica]NYF81142.1 glutamate racemase [Granulicella arctica]
MTTIGVFDSGFGGLTVLRALLPLIPGARYIYLGDTARLPYGSKSQQTIARYAVSSAQFLLDQGADILVIACNTATALALPEIQAAAYPVPVVGVIQPGAEAALTSSIDQRNCQPERSAQRAAEGPAVASAHASPNHVLVLATSATVQSHAYLHALTALGLKTTEKACPLLVPLVEEGWIDHPVTAEVLRIYLTEALAEAPHATTLVLGCTHYPLLKPFIERTLAELHHPLHIIDAAQATAHATAAILPPSQATGKPTCTFYATDSIEKFQRLGSHFLGQPLPEVHLLDLGG